jgi:hypothetical protein
MIARLGAKAVLLAIGLGMAFFGVGLLGLALAESLKVLFGTAGAFAIAGGVLLLPPFFWAVARLLFRPAKRVPPPASGLVAALVAALAKETPWIAVVGAGLTGVAELFLNRNKSRK